MGVNPDGNLTSLNVTSLEDAVHQISEERLSSDSDLELDWKNISCSSETYGPSILSL